MRSDHMGRVRAVMLAAVLLLGAAMPVALDERRSAQRVPGISPVAGTPEESWLFDDGLTEALVSEVMIILVCAVGCGLLVAGMEAVDLWRERREEKAAQLHSRIADALQRDGVLGQLAVTPIVHLPPWGGSRATIELRGYVPAVWMRYAVLRATEREAATSAAACHILNRIMVDPSAQALAS
jgi:hypothetical protein